MTTAAWRATIYVLGIKLLNDESQMLRREAVALLTKEASLTVFFARQTICNN